MLTIRDSYTKYIYKNESRLLPEFLNLTPLNVPGDKTYSKADTLKELKAYRKICAHVNALMFDYMQKGKGNRISFNNKLGEMQYFLFKKKPVNSKGKIIYPINWAETKKLWAESPELRNKNFVYYIRNWFVGCKWLKGNALNMSKYIRFYKFAASRTNGTECKTGNKNKIVSLLNSDELYHLNFPEYDIQSSKLQRNLK
jgi:hypothetical protein